MSFVHVLALSPVSVQVEVVKGHDLQLNGYCPELRIIHAIAWTLDGFALIEMLGPNSGCHTHEKEEVLQLLLCSLCFSFLTWCFQGS